MNLLFDLYTTQFFIGGGAEYVRKVFHSLLDYITKNCLNVHVVALINSSKGKFPYKDLTYSALEERKILVADLAKEESVCSIIKKFKIDKAFFGCAQYSARLGIEDIKIPSIIVVHDLFGEEFACNNIVDYVNLPLSLSYYCHRKLHRIKSWFLRKSPENLDEMIAINKLITNNSNAQLVTVSNYTRNSLCYFFNYNIESIPVLYSCERFYSISNIVNDSILAELLQKHNRYYVVLSANRLGKNAKKALRAFNRFAELYEPDSLIITTGPISKQNKRHIPLGYLSDSDLQLLVKNCYAFIFPSLFEGFGYPPIEAMKWGKPILCSNVTSMPEICGDAPIYFSPLYESDIFNAFRKLSIGDYQEYCKKSIARYQVVSTRQKNDLDTLLSMITLSDLI